MNRANAKTGRIIPLPPRRATGDKRVPVPTRTGNKRVPVPARTGNPRIPAPTKTGTQRVPAPTKTGTQRVPAPTRAGTQRVPVPTKTGTRVLKAPPTRTGTRVLKAPHTRTRARVPVPKPPKGKGKTRVLKPRIPAINPVPQTRRRIVSPPPARVTKTPKTPETRRVTRVPQAPKGKGKTRYGTGKPIRQIPPPVLPEDNIPIVPVEGRPFGQAAPAPKQKVRRPFIPTEHRKPTTQRRQIQSPIQSPLIQRRQIPSPIQSPLIQRRQIPSPENQLPRLIENVDERIRRRLSGATFALYDTVNRLAIGYPTQDELTRGAQFDQIFNRNQKISINNTVQIVPAFLMNQSEKFLTGLLVKLGLNRLRMDQTDVHNLLWYLNMFSGNLINWSEADRSYLSSLEVTQLLQLLGERYAGPTDHASLLFAALSGRSTSKPDIKDLPRYEEVKHYPPADAWNIAFYLYGVITSFGQDNIVSVYPPYVHIATQTKSILEPVIGGVRTHVDQLVEKFQVVYPPGTNYTNDEKIRYVASELRQYGPVLTRGKDYLPPPQLSGMSLGEVKEILRIYTLGEIINAYEPIGTWTDRETLTEVIHQESTGGSRWSWRHRYCNNDDTMNYDWGELHGEVDKNDVEDPTLSFGVQGNYRCYQIGELVAAFSNDEGFFRVPDFDPQDPEQKDPTTGAFLAAEFPVPSIRQLRTLLTNPPAGYQVKPLLDRINSNLRAHTAVEQATNQLKRQVDNMSEDDQNLVKIYLTWLFLDGMWMRHWKGLGTPWPAAFVEGGRVGDLCTDTEREQNVKFQQVVRSVLLSDITEDTNPGLSAWINELPVIKYNFKSGNAAIATKPKVSIAYILDKVAEGNYCISNASDLTAGTAYFLIRKFFDLDTNVKFNQFLAQNVPTVLELELNVAEWLIGNPEENASGDLAQERFDQLKNFAVLEDTIDGDEAIQQYVMGQLDLPIFDPVDVTRTGHTDPYLGRQMKFEEQ